MIKITAYSEGGECDFAKGHEVSKENADDVFQTEVTDGDYQAMHLSKFSYGLMGAEQRRETAQFYFKEKVAKLLEDRPFTKG